jgi:aryl-phospho-beta-D-glucosidase BglC (GH1 family)
MGLIYEKYKNGINLGGWLSQSSYNPQHIKEFITRDDIKIIADNSYDHVRLPVDYPILDRAEGITIIKSLVEWCKEASLNVVIDLHKTPGYSFIEREDDTFFTDEAKQNRFIAIWRELSIHLHDEGDNVLFELLNEIVDPHEQTWNNIAKKAIHTIHKINPCRHIILGGPYYNSPIGLQDLEIYNDDRIIYTFHFYEPLIFTHQRASWTPLKDIDICQPYPNPDFDPLEESLFPALEFAKINNKQLYCGEYGVIDYAKPNHRINYIRDIKTLFEKHKIGHCRWTYKGMHFGVFE